jgi:sarcosine oxidase subunit gamma
MSDRSVKQSPFGRFGLRARAAQAPVAGAIRVWEQAFLGHINVRGDAGDSRFTAAVKAVLGAELPVKANTLSIAGAIAIYWLGPDEWLVITPGDRERAIAGELRAAFGTMHVAITEVSGGQTVVELHGPRVRELLSKECPLDFDPRSFPPGTCAQSHLAKAPILLHALDDGNGFAVVIRRSFADYFWLWLEDAAAEYGLAATPEAVALNPQSPSSIFKPEGQPALS